MLNKRSLTTAKLTTKDLTTNAEQCGLLKREGEAGLAAIVVDIEKLAAYVKEHPSPLVD